MYVSVLYIYICINRDMHTFCVMQLQVYIYVYVYIYIVLIYLCILPSQASMSRAFSVLSADAAGSLSRRVSLAYAPLNSSTSTLNVVNPSKQPKPLKP